MNIAIIWRNQMCNAWWQ